MAKTWPALLALLALTGCPSDGGSNGVQEAVTSILLAGMLPPPPPPPPPGEGVFNATASPVPIFVLIGGDATSPPADQNSIYVDTRLTFGEIFILAQSPLQANTTYQVRVVAHTGSAPATEVFSAVWSFTTSALTNTNGSNGQATAILELNAYRSASGVADVTAGGGFDQAAALHAGYQRLAQQQSHEEVPPPPINVCFVDQWFWNRVSLARGGATWDGTTLPVPAGFDVGVAHADMRLSEGLAASGDLVAAVSELWNSVYHRLPLMRYDTTLFGAGHSQDAAAFVPDPDPRPLTRPARYSTFELVGDTSLVQGTSLWPPDAATGVPRSFYSDSEWPDPIGETRFTPPPNATPTRSWVGVPIHVALPVAVDFSGLVVTLTEL